MLFYLIYVFFTLIYIRNRLNNNQFVIIKFMAIHQWQITLLQSNFYVGYNIFHALKINLNLIHHDRYHHFEISYDLNVKEIHF
jgi:hypothetical protein